MEIENEFIMSQDGYASIDFTLLDRPNNNIASAPEATAVLLPDGHAADSSFPSFDLLDGSGVVGSYGYAPEGDDNQSLDQSRDGSEKGVYKEQAMHSNADNGGAASNVDYAEYQIPQSVQKTSVDFFAKNQAPQQQEQQSQLSLFGSDGAEENQEFFEAGQTSQQSQPGANSWWTPDNNWMPNNSQRDQSQVFNWAAMTEEQRRLMQMRMGVSQHSSEYPGALYSMPQAVNSDPSPSMYSFLPTNTNRLHKVPHLAEGGLNASRLQASGGEKNTQYDFQGLLNGPGFQQAGPIAQNLGLVEQQRYRTMQEQQMRMQEARNREQQLREQQLREHQLREQQLRMQEASSREQQLREQQLRDQQHREQLREQQLREHQLRMQEANSREQQLRMQEENSREQQFRLQGQQNQSFSKYDNQNMEVSPLKVSDYDFLNGGDYTMKGQSQSEVRQQLDEGEAQMWRRQQQQQQQQQQRQQLPAWQQPRQFSNYANNSYEDMHQRQQAQARQRFQQQQQLFSGNQNQASGNQFQAFLGEGSLQDLPQVMQSERANPQQMGMEGHQPFMQPNLQAVNQNNAGNHMYSPQNEAAAAGQGSINYLLGQDTSFSWHQLAMKASGLDQSMHASAASSSKAGQPNPFASAQGGSVPGFSGGMGKQPTPTSQINRPIPRSLGAGPSPLFGVDGQPAPRDDQASKAKLLFGQAKQQQQQSPSQAAKHMQGFPGNSQQGNYSPVNRQALEEAQRRQQESFRGGAVQQDGAPHVKLFAQSLTGSLDPMKQQQQQQQQHHQQQLMAANRDAQNFQVRPVNLMHQMPQAWGNHLATNPGYRYQQGVNQAAGSFLQNANDGKQQPMWNNYEMEADASQVEGPVVMPGNTDSMLKSNNWSAGSEGHPAPDSDSSLAFERSKLQQNAWSVHGAQPSNSQSSGDLGSRHHNSQSGAIVQQGTPKSTSGHPFAPQENGNMMHQGSLQSGPSMLEISELEANGRQREMQNSQEETNWRNHSLLQVSPQQSAATNSSLQAFTDMDRSQSNWKSLWQNVPTGGNASQLTEAEKEQQSTMWAQNNSHVAGPQPELSDDPNARIAQSGWSGAQGAMQAAVSGESQQTPGDEQQVMLSGSPQPPQSFQDVDGRQQLSNQGPNFQEAMSQATLSDNDPSPASRHADQSFQHSSPFSHPLERDRNAIIQNSDLGGHSASISAEHQRSLNQANLLNQGRINAWAPDTRQRLDDTSVPLLDSSGQHEGRVQLQLNNQHVENRLSAMMNARASTMQEESSGTQPLRAMNTVGGFRHHNDHERYASMNGGAEGVMAGWAPGQMTANQSKFGGRPLAFGNTIGNASMEHFVPSRPESAGDEQTNYANSMLAQRARYSGRRDMVDPGRNTLELLNRTEQEAEASGDQDGSALEDGSGPAATSLAHLRPGPMGISLLQRPTPSRPDLMSREQVDLQLSRNMEGYHQGRNLLHDFSREEGRAYGQIQMQSQMQPQMQSQMQAQMQSQMQAQMQAQSMRAAAQLQAENMARQGQVQDRMSMNPALLGANRHHPVDSRQKAEMFYRSLNQAQKIQFQQRLAQQNHLRSTAAAHSMDRSNMPSGLDPRIVAQQHMSRVGYQDRPGMPVGLSPEKQLTVPDMVVGSPGQVGVGLPQAQPGALQQSQQLQQAAPAAPLVKKRKEYPPLVPWRTTISQGSTNLPTTSRAELEWASATNSAPDQERFNDAVEALDVTTLCVKRARRRLKFTTQLMQQIVPALPCQLFRGNLLDDYKSATFVLAKFAVSEACWLATGLNRAPSGAVAIEEITENSKPSDAVAIEENSKPSGAVATEERTENSKPSSAVAVIEESTENGDGNIPSAKNDQHLAVVKRGSSLAIPSQLEIRFKQKIAEFQDELSRLESAPTALKLARELHDLDKLAVVNRMAKVHGSEFLSGLTNPTGSPRGKQDTHGEAPVMYSPENAYPERFVAAVFVPQRIPDNLILFPL